MTITSAWPTTLKDRVTTISASTATMPRKINPAILASRDLGAVNMQKKTPPWYSTTAFGRMLLLLESSILALSECEQFTLTRTLPQNRECATQLSILWDLAALFGRIAEGNASDARA